MCNFSIEEQPISKVPPTILIGPASKALPTVCAKAQFLKTSSKTPTKILSLTMSGYEPTTIYSWLYE